VSTDIRPELSKKNPYWIPKHRYYELKHFVMQYPDWIAARNGLTFIGVPTHDVRIKTDISDPTMSCAELRQFYSDKIDMVDRADAGCGCKYYVLQGILHELSYEKLLVRYPPVLYYTKEAYYICYRKFFWLLNQERR
jgi:hypothetical protein